MTDLEMIRVCAEKMGLNVAKGEDSWWIFPKSMGNEYDPLHDDAQAMALVKKFSLEIKVLQGNVAPSSDYSKTEIYEWGVSTASHDTNAKNKDLNRAIVECVSKLN